MSKISREDNKKRFKTGMYPTQQDFENVFDSYVHKDDTIDPSKIVSGKENIVDIINRKAEEKHSHEIKDVDGLQTFITEMTSLLEIVRDPETGEISQSKLKTLTDGIAALRDDIDTNADNVAGHESRIQTNEAALEKVYQILGKDAKESIADLANRFTALSGNYANVYAFINKVKQFLEDADASDETINRWQEIENFLQGITDTKTLTGLLQDLKTEILAEIPEPQSGNYLKQIPDLDGYTEAQAGEIVQYVGQTNDQYTRGYIYERKVTEGVTRNIGTVTSCNPSGLIAVGTKFILAYSDKEYWYGSIAQGGKTYTFICFEKPAVNSTVYELILSSSKIVENCDCEEVTEGNNKVTCKLWVDMVGYLTVDMMHRTDGYNLIDSGNNILGYKPKVGTITLINEQPCIMSYHPDTEEIPGESSWQILPVSPVVS